MSSLLLIRGAWQSRLFASASAPYDIVMGTPAGCSVTCAIANRSCNVGDVLTSVSQ
jgi:hypothetical protein